MVQESGESDARQWCSGREGAYIFKINVNKMKFLNDTEHCQLEERSKVF